MANLCMYQYAYIGITVQVFFKLLTDHKFLVVMYEHTHMSTHAYIYVYMYVCMYVCMYIYIYIYIYIVYNMHVCF
jgi:hypothetical protein